MNPPDEGGLWLAWAVGEAEVVVVVVVVGEEEGSLEVSDVAEGASEGLTDAEGIVETGDRVDDMVSVSSVEEAGANNVAVNAGIVALTTVAAAGGVHKPLLYVTAPATSPSPSPASDPSSSCRLPDNSLSTALKTASDTSTELDEGGPDRGGRTLLPSRGRVAG